MTEENTPLPAEKLKRFDLFRPFRFLFRPGSELQKLAGYEESFWQLPMLILSLTLIARIVVHGYFQAQAAAMGQVTLPQDWQWWTPEMQNTFMQANQAWQSPAYVYYIPGTLGLMGLWGGWAVLSALIHLVSTLLGGRGSNGSTLNMVAWASLPFALRDLLKVIFMLSAQRTIVSQGLSGFVAASDNWMIFLSQLLAQTDLFVLWHLILLTIGIRTLDNLTLRKGFSAAFIVLLLSILTQAALGMLVSRLSSMLLVNRPF